MNIFQICIFILLRFLNSINSILEKKKNHSKINISFFYSFNCFAIDDLFSTRIENLKFVIWILNIFFNSTLLLKKKIITIRLLENFSSQDNEKILIISFVTAYDFEIGLVQNLIWFVLFVIRHKTKIIDFFKLVRLINKILKIGLWLLLKNWRLKLRNNSTLIIELISIKTIGEINSK